MDSWKDLVNTKSQEIVYDETGLLSLLDIPIPNRNARISTAEQMESELVQDVDYEGNLSFSVSIDDQELPPNNFVDELTDTFEESRLSDTSAGENKFSKVASVDSNSFTPQRPSSTILELLPSLPVDHSAKAEFSSKPRGHLVKGAVSRGVELSSTAEHRLQKDTGFKLDLKGTKLQAEVNTGIQLVGGYKKSTVLETHIDQELNEGIERIESDSEIDEKEQKLERDVRKSLSRIASQIKDHSLIATTAKVFPGKMELTHLESSISHIPVVIGGFPEWDVMFKPIPLDTIALEHVFLRKASIAKNLEISDIILRAGTKLLEALTRKLQLELDILIDKMKVQRIFQAKKQFQLESHRATRNFISRSIRDNTATLPPLQHIKKDLIHYLQETAKVLFMKEKKRNQRLMDIKLHNLIEFCGRQHYKLRRNLVDVLEFKEEKITLISESKRFDGEVVRNIHRLTDDLQFVAADYEKLSAHVEEMRKLKSIRIQEVVLRDSLVQSRELDLLIKSLESRKALGFTTKSVKEMDLIDLDGCDIDRVPVAELNAKTVRHLSMRNTKLTNMNNIGLLRELNSINTDNNFIEEIDLMELQNLKSLSIAGNQLKTLKGLSARIFSLNVTANLFTDLSGLEGAPALRILIMSKSLVRDFSQIKFLPNLLYLDVSASGLSEKILENLYNCTCLQYLSASKNKFTSFPEIVNPSLYELHLADNMIYQLRVTSWQFNLRVLDISENQVMDVVPLTMCPFLRILNLSYNLIKGTTNV